MNECLLRAVASRARLFKAKMQSVFSSHCWEHFRISLSISYQAFFHTHGAFLLGTVSENLSIVCQHVLIIKLDMKSTMSSFDSFKGVWISSVCCIGFALLWYILKRGVFFTSKFLKMKMCNIPSDSFNGCCWVIQATVEAFKTSLFSFYTPTPISKCSFCFFCSFLLQLHSPPSPAPKFDNHVLSDNEVSVC